MIIDIPRSVADINAQPCAILAGATAIRDRKRRGDSAGFLVLVQELAVMAGSYGIATSSFRRIILADCTFVWTRRSHGLRGAVCGFLATGGTSERTHLCGYCYYPQNQQRRRRHCRYLSFHLFVTFFLFLVLVLTNSAQVAKASVETLIAAITIARPTPFLRCSASGFRP